MPEHIKSQTTIASISDRRCVLADMARQSLGADRCPTATSMNKAVCTTHCGIGIVSDPIRWRVECAGWGEESGGGLRTCSHLMPWQRCVPLRTKPQALSFLLPLQWQRVNRRDNCSQGITSAPLLEEVQQRRPNRKLELYAQHHYRSVRRNHTEHISSVTVKIQRF